MFPPSSESSFTADKSRLFNPGIPGFLWTWLSRTRNSQDPRRKLPGMVCRQYAGSIVVPGLARKDQSGEETIQDNGFPRWALRESAGPRVTYVCGGGAGQGHRLHRCRESECGLCLFIFRGVGMTGLGGCWGKGSKPQHCIVFWRTTYIPREGNKRGKGGGKDRGKMVLTYLWPVFLIG